MSEPEPRNGKIIEWVDRRTGLNTIMKVALKEPIPGGARWAYIFGSGLIFTFMLQAITGIFLTLYYSPSADHAYTTVSYITKEVTSGSLIRSIHAYGSSAMVIILILHLTQTFLFGSYKGRRELLWLSGTVLFSLILGMAFTGYLLPWDQNAYFATTVGTNVAGEVPIVGDWIKRLMRGGNDMGTLTISRFFSLHVLFIPAMIAIFVSLHVYLFRKAGAAGPYAADPVEPNLPEESFYPRQLLMDVAFAAVLIAVLAGLARFSPADLGPRANPADTQYLGRPEWYYRSVFQWLKYWNPPYTIIGVLVIPAVVGALFVGLPFYDRRKERRPWKRPVAVFVFLFILGGLIYIGRASYVEDQNNPGVRDQILQQEKETERLMSQPFEPELAGVAKAAPVAISPAAERGKAIFERMACGACHGEGGTGGLALKLAGIGARFPNEKLTELLRKPTPKMLEGGMSPSPLKDPELKDLAEYLTSLKPF
ncbi:MAG: cytochrome b N-terminal domain-containing protein [Deltaproteobacteria bacterium]|nr:cytochrome b N-terminal domain-containing protein [Deltaproteobacteria bacterium]